MDFVCVEKVMESSSFVVNRALPSHPQRVDGSFVFGQIKGSIQQLLN